MHADWITMEIAMPQTRTDAIAQVKHIPEIEIDIRSVPASESKMHAQPGGFNTTLQGT